MKFVFNREIFIDLCYKRYFSITDEESRYLSECLGYLVQKEGHIRRKKQEIREINSLVSKLKEAIKHGKKHDEINSCNACKST